MAENKTRFGTVVSNKVVLYFAPNLRNTKSFTFQVLELWIESSFPFLLHGSSGACEAALLLLLASAMFGFALVDVGGRGRLGPGGEAAAGDLPTAGLGLAALDVGGAIRRHQLLGCLVVGHFGTISGCAFSSSDCDSGTEDVAVWRMHLRLLCCCLAFAQLLA